MSNSRIDVTYELWTSFGRRMARSGVAVSMLALMTYALPPPAATPLSPRDITLVSSTIYMSSDVPKEIPDATSETEHGYTTSTVTVPSGLGTITDVNLVGISIGHTWPSDLVVRIESPGVPDRTVWLFEDRCHSEDWTAENTGFGLDDAAPTTMEYDQDDPSCPPGTGTYWPSDPLWTFDGEDAAGEWTLHVWDDTPLDTGTLIAWGLEITAAIATDPKCPGYESDTRNQIVGTAGNDNLTGTSEADIICGLGGNDRIAGNAAGDYLLGGDGNDVLLGGDGHDLFRGEGGNDILQGHAGFDDVDGGAGVDTASYVQSPAGVTVNLFQYPPSLSGGHADGDTMSGIENLMGSNHDDSLTGTTGPNKIHGGAGADTMSGVGGHDYLDYIGSNAGVVVNLASSTHTVSGGHAQGDTATTFESVFGSAYADRLTGSSGVNVLRGLVGNDIISASAGNDIVDGGDGNDSLAGGAGADRVTGGLGLDTASFSASTAAVTIDLSTAPVTASGGDATGDTIATIENLIGSRYNDNLTGTTGPNRIRGGAGADTMSGLGGFDYLDYIGSNAGVTVDLSTSPHIVSGGHAAGDMASSFESVTGSAYDDSLTGTGLVNILIGAAGNDTLSGLAGNDRLFGRAGTDTFDGGDGTDSCDEVSGESVTSCEV